MIKDHHSEEYQDFVAFIEGEKIRNIRKRLGVTQKTLATLLGCSTSLFVKLEANRRDAPRPKKNVLEFLWLFHQYVQVHYMKKGELALYIERFGIPRTLEGLVKLIYKDLDGASPGAVEQMNRVFQLKKEQSPVEMIRSVFHTAQVITEQIFNEQKTTKAE